VAITGITGTRSAAAGEVGEALRALRRHTALPIAVGFGIRTPEQAAEMGQVADAVVVGSALIERLAERLDGAGRPRAGCAEGVLNLVRGLSRGLAGNG
jgi:tryptophan synthase alpha chain